MQNKVTSREKLIEAGGKLFLEKGFDATSVQDICRHANVSKGAFYHYFETKQVLFMILMEQWSSEIMQSTLSQSVSEGLTVGDQLVQMPFKFTSAFESVAKGFPILVDFWRQAMDDPDMWKMAVMPYRYFTQFFVRVIENGKKDGSIRPDIDNEVMARLLVAIAMGYLLEAAYEQNDGNPQEIAAEGIRLTLEGIGGKR